MASQMARRCALSLCALGQVSAHALSSRQTTDTQTSPYTDAVSKYVDSISETLWPINTEIHENPELQYEEVKAHDLLTSFLESQEGWNVTRSAYNINAAFTAVFQGDGEGPVVSFNAEYDALKGLGHACGHNLIAMASLSGALATAELMRTEKLSGTVVLFGTPAEEGGGGKILLNEAGAYRDHKIDISLISHPSSGGDSPYMPTTSTDTLDIEYHGKAAHAAAAPYEGINAQDALVLAYDALSMLRQQTRSTDIIQGFIRSGGSLPNVIPDLSAAQFVVRAADDSALRNLTERVHRCFEAGAVATGAALNLTTRPRGYSNMVTNDVLAGSYAAWFAALGHGGLLVPAETARKRQGTASTDQGNISHDFPSISAVFGITNEDGSVPKTGPHTPPFEVASRSRRAFDKSLLVGKSLAGVAIDVLTVDGLLDKVKEEFSAVKKVPRARRSIHI